MELYLKNLVNYFFTYSPNPRPSSCFLQFTVTILRGLNVLLIFARLSLVSTTQISTTTHNYHTHVPPTLPQLPPQIRTIDRVCEIPHEGPFCDLMWSDPEDIETWAVSPRGAGWLFGRKVTSEFNQINGEVVVDGRGVGWARVG